ncbi:MAG: response regulator transcription factor [Bacteroidota bacterium]
MTHRVAIVDDHVLIAKALTAIIEKLGPYRVLYEVENGQQLTQRFQEPRNIPDVVLLDVNMPVMDGFETATWLKAQHPQVHILALSVRDEEDTLIRMIKAGAQGYLLKNARPPELKLALESVMSKGFYYPDWATHKVFQALTTSGASEEIALSQREKELLQYIATELTYKEIADKMCCSPRTVESHRDSLFEKFGVKSRVSLVVYAIRAGLISV